jgi:hypothetical protein
VTHVALCRPINHEQCPEQLANIELGEMERCIRPGSRGLAGITEAELFTINSLSAKSIVCAEFHITNDPLGLEKFSLDSFTRKDIPH